MLTVIVCQARELYMLSQSVSRPATDSSSLSTRQSAITVRQGSANRSSYREE